MAKSLTLSVVAFALLVAAALGSGLASASVATRGPGPTGPGSYKYWGIPRSAVEVDKGKFGSIRWTVRMHSGSGKKICIWLGDAGPKGIDGSKTCREDLSPPSDDWLPIVGSSVEVGSPYSVSLDVTSTRVRSLKLLIGPKPLIHRQVQAEIISRAEAAKAHLDRNFRFYVIHRRAELCVKHVTLFDSTGEQIDAFPTPCEI